MFIPGNLWSDPSYRVSFFTGKYTPAGPTNKNSDVKFLDSRNLRGKYNFFGRLDALIFGTSATSDPRSSRG